MFLFLLKDLYNFLVSWLNFLFFVQVTFLLSAVVFAVLRRSLTHTRIVVYHGVQGNCLYFMSSVLCCSLVPCALWLRSLKQSSLAVWAGHRSAIKGPQSDSRWGFGSFFHMWWLEGPCKKWTCVW